MPAIKYIEVLENIITVNISNKNNAFQFDYSYQHITSLYFLF